jgi:hypothetical protein
MKNNGCDNEVFRFGKSDAIVHFVVAAHASGGRFGLTNKRRKALFFILKFGDCARGAPGAIQINKMEKS